MKKTERKTTEKNKNYILLLTFNRRNTLKSLIGFLFKILKYLFFNGKITLRKK